MTVTREQVRMARAALGWTVRELAERAGVHPNTISNFEVGRYAGELQTLVSIQRALETAGVSFVEENGEGPGVRLRKRKLGRRASEPR
jgi:DNA-binding XRE family transcriptional regulator